MAYDVALPLPPAAQILVPPGMTPSRRPLGAPAAAVPLRSTSAQGGFAAARRDAPSARGTLMEGLEDAALVLLLVFMVPAVIMLLAAPLMLMRQVAVYVAPHL